jgi:hypothetical protein
VVRGAAFLLLLPRDANFFVPEDLRALVVDALPDAAVLPAPFFAVARFLLPLRAALFLSVLFFFFAGAACAPHASTIMALATNQQTTLRSMLFPV